MCADLSEYFGAERKALRPKSYAMAKLLKVRV